MLIDRTVAQAAAAFDPDPVHEAQDQARLSWNVRLTHRTDGSFAGTSHLEATGDTLALTKLYDLVCDHAHRLATLGDTDPSAPARPRPSASSPTPRPTSTSPVPRR